MPIKATPLIERLKSKILKTDSCWIWQGTISKDTGYGVISVVGHKGKQAHVAVYELFIGKVPASHDLDHLCRVRHCVNPDHLEPVTHAENARRGNQTKLSLAQVLFIKASTLKQSEIADIFGVSQSQVSRIKNNQRWRIA